MASLSPFHLLYTHSLWFQLSPAWRYHHYTVSASLFSELWVQFTFPIKYLYMDVSREPQTKKSRSLFFPHTRCVLSVLTTSISISIITCLLTQARKLRATFLIVATKSHQFYLQNTSRICHPSISTATTMIVLVRFFPGQSQQPPKPCSFFLFYCLVGEYDAWNCGSHCVTMRWQA